MKNSKIRVAFFGNTCNNYYRLIKLLKDTSEFEFHLFIDNRSDPQQRPESDDPLLTNTHPSWIHYGDFITTKTILFPWTSPLVKEFDSFDLLVVSHFGPVFTQFSRTPSVFMSLGADLTVHPFALSFLNLYYHSIKEKIGAIPMSFWQRRGLRRMKQIWTQPFSPFVHALKKLEIDHSSICQDYTPIPIDIPKFESTTPGPEALELRAKYDFIVFSPSRIMIQDHPKLIQAGNWKANDILIHGFQNFLSRNPTSNAALVMIDRPASADKEVLKKLAKDLGISSHIVWLKPRNGFGYSRRELTDFYLVSDVVADDFSVGWFGSVVIEALSLGINVLSYVDEEVMSKIYPWHPLHSSRDPMAIADMLERLCKDSEFKKMSAAKGKKWVYDFHTGEALITKYKERLLKAFSRQTGSMSYS